ncbi:MAG: hypothetical protein J6N76_00380, partial [Lachnospiraceae bacterium]|nr:hypothetical protein [Lachnospiraceae bacterium]
MRKKIYRLSEGQFNRSVSLVSAEPSEIDIECREGILCEGSFMVKSGDDTGLKGVVYSSNPCVICPNPSFEGNECSIRFCTIHNGFKEGDELKGGFTVITDGAKLTIPYSIRFTSSCLDASTGPIRDLSEYTAFAEEHWNEALRLFRTEDFESMIERTDNKLMPLYQGYKNALPNSKNLEGFLTAVGVKPRVSFEVDRKELSYYGIRENLKESLKITRSGWGYIEIEVSCDADYITVDTNRITPDFFLGSTMELSFFIHKDKLHDGKNPASITLSGGGERRVISIVASRNEKDAYVHMADLKNDRKWLEVFKLYERYRLRQCTTGEWCAGSVELLDALYADDDSPVYPLIKAHALIVNKQRQDALWLIQDLRQTIEDKRSAEWAYLLYLCTLIEPEEEYVDKLTAEIENIFLEEESLYIFWFLLFLRKEYLSDFGRKLSDIRKWVKAGYPSPLLYIEAYDLYCQDPFLLKRFDDFSMKVLGWVRKHDGMTGNLAIRITHLVEEEKEYKEEVYELAAYTYSRYPDDNLLTAIIRLLLLGSRTGEKYLSWYTAGIEKELKVTGIFEAYILSLPRDYVDPLPRPVLLYFNYQNTLPARSKAFIYANIIMHKKDSRETYEQYISQMETFALAEMREGHIDDNLAIVYQELL